MTPEQCRLVVDYREYALYLRRRFFPDADDEYDGVALEALCAAAVRWEDSETGAFGGYLRKAIHGSLITFHRSWHREQGRAGRAGRWVIESTDAPVYRGDERDPGSVLDMEGFSEPDIADDAASSVDVWAALDRCPRRVQGRAVRYASGWTMTEIADDEGVTESAVSRAFAYWADRNT